MPPDSVSAVSRIQMLRLLIVREIRLLPLAAARTTTAHVLARVILLRSTTIRQDRATAKAQPRKFQMAKEVSRALVQETLLQIRLGTVRVLLLLLRAQAKRSSTRAHVNVFLALEIWPRQVVFASARLRLQVVTPLNISAPQHVSA